MRSLSTPKIEYSNKEVKHEFCIHTPLNELMLDIAVKLNVISSNTLNNTLDYDNVIIETEKYDSCWTYEKTKGYQPGVAFIGQTPVYIEGRNGNSPASYKMKDTLARCLQLLNSRNIPIKYFRSDSAAYQFEVVKLMELNNIQFFIRADTNNVLKTEAQLITDWQKVEFGNSYYEVGEMDYMPFYDKYTIAKERKFYRAIVKRVKDKDGKFIYYSILTNNKTKSKLDVLHFYNQRGAMERNFDDLKNNFNWKRIPFSFLNENVVFMIIGAITSIIYDYLIKTFSKKVDFVKRTHRLKNFIFHFITVSSQWINNKLELFTNKNYKKIFE